MKSARGFTLIELLVVISIIALLSGVVMTNLNTARSKSRDARRMADMKSVQVAIEMYKNDNGSFPNTGNGWWGTCSQYGSHTTSGSNGWVPNVAPAYISELPTEVRQTAIDTCYLYRSNGLDYMILSHKTVENLPVPSAFIRPNYSTQNTYAIFTEGARTW